MRFRQEFLKYYALVLTYQQFEGQKMVLYYNELFDSSLKYLDRFFDLTSYAKDNLYFADSIHELSTNYNSHLQSSLLMYKNKTNEKGAALGDIPSIYFNNPLLRLFL